MALLHLTRRILGSLSPRPLDERDDQWARRHLRSGEAQLWGRMPVTDRKHAAGVAREVERRLGDDATRPVIAAALLHDVGKLDSGLGTFGRVAATVASATLGHGRVAAWRHRPGIAGRLGRYAVHATVGGDLLDAAGSDPLTVAWAREHHASEASWSVPVPVGRALRDADDD